MWECVLALLLIGAVAVFWETARICKEALDLNERAKNLLREAQDHLAKVRGLS